MCYADLKNDLLSNKDVSASNIIVTKSSIKCLGLKQAFLKKVFIKYKDSIDLKTFVINEFFESDLIFLKIGIYREKYFNNQLEFVLKNKNCLTSWASTDSIFQLFEDIPKEILLQYIKKLIEHEDNFIRRLGYLFLFRFKDDDISEYIMQIFKKDDDYYVAMAEAWVLAEFYIKNPEKVIDLFKKDTLNKFIINKTISKICDSYRVSKANKLRAKEFRVYGKEN